MSWGRFSLTSLLTFCLNINECHLYINCFKKHNADDLYFYVTVFAMPKFGCILRVCSFCAGQGSKCSMHLNDPSNCHIIGAVMCRSPNEGL